jgi:hypothetical protein
LEIIFSSAEDFDDSQ